MSVSGSGSKPELLQTAGEQFRQRRQRELARERLARQTEQFREEDIGTRFRGGRAQAFVRREARERELRESLLAEAGDEFGPADVQFVEREGDELGATLKPQAIEREVREDVLEQASDDFTAADVVTTETEAGQVTGRIAAEAQRRELVEDVLAKAGDEFTEEDVVTRQTEGGRFTGRIAAEAQRRELVEDVLEQAGPGFTEADVAVQDTEEGRTARLRETAVERELSEAARRTGGEPQPSRPDPGAVRQAALEEAAAEFEQFSESDLRLAERGGETVVTPTKAAQRRELREAAAERAGISPERVRITRQDGEFQAQRVVERTEPVFKTVEREVPVQESRRTGPSLDPGEGVTGTKTVEELERVGTRTVTETVPLLSRERAARRVEATLSNRAAQQITERSRQQRAVGLTAGTRAEIEGVNVDLSAEDVRVGDKQITLTEAGRQTVREAGGVDRAAAAQRVEASLANTTARHVSRRSRVVRQTGLTAGGPGDIQGVDVDLTGGDIRVTDRGVRLGQTGREKVRAAQRERAATQLETGLALEGAPVDLSAGDVRVNQTRRARRLSRQSRQQRVVGLTAGDAGDLPAPGAELTLAARQRVTRARFEADRDEIATAFESQLAGETARDVSQMARRGTRTGVTAGQAGDIRGLDVELTGADIRLTDDQRIVLSESGRAAVQQAGLERAAERAETRLALRSGADVDVTAADVRRALDRPPGGGVQSIFERGAGRDPGEFADVAPPVAVAAEPGPGSGRTVFETVSPGARLFGTQERELEFERQARQGSFGGQLFVAGERIEQAGLQVSEQLDRIIPETFASETRAGGSPASGGAVGGTLNVATPQIAINPAIGLPGTEGQPVMQQVRSGIVGVPSGLGFVGGLLVKPAGDIGLRAERALGREVDEEAAFQSPGEVVSGASTLAATSVRGIAEAPVATGLGVAAGFGARAVSPIRVRRFDVPGEADATPDVRARLARRAGARVESARRGVEVDVDVSDLESVPRRTVRGVRLETPAIARRTGIQRQGRTVVGLRGRRATLGAPEVDFRDVDIERLGQGKGQQGPVFEAMSEFEADVEAASLAGRPATEFETGRRIIRRAEGVTGRAARGETRPVEEVIREVEELPDDVDAAAVTEALAEVDATIFGSGAVAAQARDFRAPGDIDIVVPSEARARAKIGAVLEDTSGDLSAFDIKEAEDFAGLEAGEVFGFGRRSQTPIETPSGVRVNPIGEELQRKAGASLFLRGEEVGRPGIDVGPRPVRGAGTPIREKDVTDTAAIAEELLGEGDEDVAAFRDAFEDITGGADRDTPGVDIDVIGRVRRPNRFALGTRGQVTLAGRRRRTPVRQTRREDVDTADMVRRRAAPEVDERSPAARNRARRDSLTTSRLSSASAGVRGVSDGPSVASFARSPGQPSRQSIAGGPSRSVAGEPPPTSASPAPSAPPSAAAPSLPSTPPSVISRVPSLISTTPSQTPLITTGVSATPLSVEPRTPSVPTTSITTSRTPRSASAVSQTSKAAESPVSETIVSPTATTRQRRGDGQDEEEPRDELFIGVGGEFSKEFEQAIASPETVLTGTAEDLGDVESFSERSMTPLDTDLDVEVTEVQGAADDEVLF